MVEGLPVIKATTGVCKGCVIGNHPEHKFDRGRQTELQAYWGWYILISVVWCLSHPWMDQGIFLLLLMIFQGTHGFSFSKRKSEVCENFSKLKALIENASGLKIKILRYDNGGDYVSNELLHIFSQMVFRSNIQFPTVPNITELRKGRIGLSRRWPPVCWSQRSWLQICVMNPCMLQNIFRIECHTHPWNGRPLSKHISDTRRMCRIWRCLGPLHGPKFGLIKGGLCNRKA